MTTVKKKERDWLKSVEDHRRNNHRHGKGDKKRGERETHTHTLRVRDKTERERDPTLRERLRDPAHAIKRSRFLMRMY